jgi:hypothetical protein
MRRLVEDTILVIRRPPAEWADRGASFRVRVFRWVSRQAASSDGPVWSSAERATTAEAARRIG